MSYVPKIPESPLEVLNNVADPREEPLISKYWMPTWCGVLAFTGTVFSNWAIKRPMFSGIQRHAILTASGVAIGFWIDKYRNQYLAERDAVFRHYIELHPEDFPPYERKKFGEVFEEWIPLR